MSFWVRISGPICVVAGGQVHAGDALRSVKSNRKTYDTKCGKRGKALGHSVKDSPGDGIAAYWPPYVADAREWGYERCKDCMRLAPGKPERNAVSS